MPAHFLKALVVVSLSLLLSSSAAIAESNLGIAGTYLGPMSFAIDREEYGLGLRGGHWLTHTRQAWEFSFETYRDVVPSDALSDRTMFDRQYLEFSLVRQTRSGILILGGPGLILDDIEMRTSGSEVVSRQVKDTHLTAHLGVGYSINLSERFSLRPDLRLRWVDEEGTSDGDDLEWRVAVGVHFRLGKPNPVFKECAKNTSVAAAIDECSEDEACSGKQINCKTGTWYFLYLVPRAGHICTC
jgi:hypothetical protein